MASPSPYGRSRFPPAAKRRDDTRLRTSAKREAASGADLRLSATNLLRGSLCSRSRMSWAVDYCETANRVSAVPSRSGYFLLKTASPLRDSGLALRLLL